MVKNAKKRALNEGEAVQKVVVESSNSNKSFKKKKFENAGSTQNGQAQKGIKQDASKKPNKGNVQNKEAVQNSAKNAQKQKLEMLKKRQESRAENKLMKQEKGELKTNRPVREMSIPQIKERIKELQYRDKLSKTAKRKLAMFKKKLIVAQGGTIIPKQPVAKKGKKTDKSVEASKKKQGDAKNSEKKEKPGSLLLTKQNAEDDDDDDDEDEDDFKVESDDSELDNESEKNEDDDDVDGESEEEEEEDDEEEEDKDDDDNDDEDIGEDSKEASPKVSPLKENKNQEGKKKRYVLFVGNLPYSATSADIEKHFATAGTVSSVRIPNKPGTKSPRGIAYVEFNNSTDYEKALSLDHTFIQGRRINVQYSAPGSKDVNNKKEIVAKNMKLQALKKAGKLAGSENKGFQKNNWKKGKRN